MINLKYTNDLILMNAKFPSQQKIFKDNNLKNLHIDYIFNYPYKDHETNNYGLHLINEVQSIKNNKCLFYF